MQQTSAFDESRQLASSQRALNITTAKGLAIRAGHLRTILGLARQSGRALLVTELISNRELPALATASEDALPALAWRTVLQQTSYSATNPAAIVAWLMKHRPQGGRLMAPGIVGPWRWTLSSQLCYLVVALLLTTFSRTVTPAP